MDRTSVAVLLSGSFRTLLDCNSTLVSNVFGANPSWDFHVYAALTVNDESERPAAEKAARESYPCVAAFKVEIDTDTSAAVKRDVPGIELLPRGRGTAHGKAFNIIKMFRGIWVAHRQLRSESRAACASGVRMAAGRPAYDLVLRVRPDLCFCKPLDLTLVLQSNKEAVTWFVPWWSTELAWAFDQIAVGTMGSMSAYSSAYRTTVRTLVSKKIELYPEAVMWEHLRTHGGAEQLRPLRGFHATLARPRASGHAFHDDPFGKLRQDAAGTRTIIPRPPANACIATVKAMKAVGRRHRGKGEGRRRRARMLAEREALA